MMVPFFEVPTRWVKVIKDIWNNRRRSLLVVASIAVGIAAVGMINTARVLLQEDLNRDFAAGTPASLMLVVSPFEKNLAESVESLREVAFAEARRSLDVQVQNNDGKWLTLGLDVLPNFNDRELNRFTLEQGSGSPGGREILLERQSAAGLDLAIGDSLKVRLPEGRDYTLRVAGIVHDVYVMPYSLMESATGYIRMETLQGMGESAYYNRILLTTTKESNDRRHVLQIGELARDRVIEPAGYSVFRMQIPGVNSDPGQHWAHNQIKGFLLILQIMGILAILLSGGLIINTISAMLTQQMRQIGILRAIGGTRRQLVGMYLVNILVLSLAALLLAIPLGLAGARGLVNLAAGFLNFNPGSVSLPPQVLILQVVLGLLMPLLASLYPVLSGMRKPVYEAIYQQAAQEEEKHNLVDRFLFQLQALSPPVLLSLRNTFRKKTRLGFTLATLALAGAMFISVFSTRSTLTGQIEQVSRYVDFDVSLGLNPGVRQQTAVREALRIPGVSVAEGWAQTSGVVLHLDGTESKAMDVVGLPRESSTIEPVIKEGSWLDGQEPFSAVINEDLLDTESGLLVGDLIQVKSGDATRWFTIVGITSRHLSDPRMYISLEDFGKFTGRQNQVDVVRVKATPGATAKPAQQEAIASLLEQRFDTAGLSQQKSTTQDDIFSDMSMPFNIILMVLVIMAVILSVVGGLGLTGVMGLNILERTREIGVLRAIGASSRSVVQVVVIEGIVVGLLSWLLGGIVSIPSGFILSAAVVSAVLQAEVVYRYSALGLMLWLAIIVGIGVISSLAPARNAARLTVREVLEYE
jgi:putative ABC transport system permease protein